MLLSLLALAAAFAGPITMKPPVVTQVYIGSSGPYSFVVDTGAQSSVIDPVLAAELGLQPSYRVEVVTQHGSSLVTATKVDNLRFAGKTLAPTEVLFQDLAAVRRTARSARGVLGMNALRNFNFLLLPSAGRVDLTAARPPGEVIPFELVEDRIVVRGRMGKEMLSFVFDSGATHMVLFGTPEAMAGTPPVPANLSTIEGTRSVAPTTWSADLLLGGRVRIRTQPAAVVDRSRSKVSGLLPAAVFKQVFVDSARRELVVVPSAPAN